MVERLCNYKGEVIKRSFRNRMRKEVSLKLHNIASKFSFRLVVKLRSSGRRTNETQKHLVYILLLFVDINVQRHSVE